MNMEPMADSTQNTPEFESNATSNEMPPQEAAQKPGPGSEDAPAQETADAASSPSLPVASPEPPASNETPTTDEPAVPPPTPKPASPVEIAASITNTEDMLLDQSVEEAVAGITEEELSGAAAVPPDTAEPTEGALLSGRIANIGSDDVLIDFGGKDLGTMPLGEFEKGETYAIGDDIEVMVIGQDPRGGLMKVSRRRARQAVALRDMKPGRVFEVKVTGMNKGGLEVTVEGLRGFIPASQVDVKFVKDISVLIGQAARAEVTKFENDDENPNIVLSRRKVLLREEAERRLKLFDDLEVGQIRRGKVRSTTDFGAFVDLGGVDGLLHIRDMSWGRVNKSEDVVKPGEQIDVKIIKINKEKRKVSLSLKQTVTNPWQNAAEKYVPGSKLQGRVVRMADFGAFIELEPGVDGLLPVSEMSWTRRVRHPSEIVKEGDVVEVSILNVDAEKNRISLSLKALGEDPWTSAAERYVVGSMIKGKVVRTTDFGAFVQLEDGIDGLVHISELSDQHVKAVTDKVNTGEEVEVRVLGVDAEEKRVSLSLRKPPEQPSPEEMAKAQAERDAAARKRPSKPRRGGITFGWDEGLQGLDPSKFAQ